MADPEIVQKMLSPTLPALPFQGRDEGRGEHRYVKKDTNGLRAHNILLAAYVGRLNHRVEPYGACMLAVFRIDQAEINRSVVEGNRIARFRNNIAAHSTAFRNALVDSSQ